MAAVAVRWRVLGRVTKIDGDCCWLYVVPAYYLLLVLVLTGTEMQRYVVLLSSSGYLKVTLNR